MPLNNYANQVAYLSYLPALRLYPFESFRYTYLSKYHVNIVIVLTCNTCGGNLFDLPITHCLKRLPLGFPIKFAHLTLNLFV